jgi:two-component system nitrogen regulation response regulator GlnG
MAEPRAKTQVWVVDDDRSIRWVLEQALADAGLEVTSFAEGVAALSALSSGPPDVLLTDIRMPGPSGFALLDHLAREVPGLPVIVMTAYTDLGSAAAAYQGGAFDFLPKPFDIDDATRLVLRACAQARTSNGGHDAPEPAMGLIGDSAAMRELYRAIGRLAGPRLTVLITGETGTGKELVAHALHDHSPRARAPFIALNTAAIPQDLLESELFGHERGAFTGAHVRRVGRFEQADHGTLFLDEIGDMPVSLQTRLLRVLAEGEFFRVGGQTPRRVDVRIVAATHQDLAAKVGAGRFREDLLYRLNVARIHVPSLREHRADIPMLARQFLADAAREAGVPSKTLSVKAESFLTELPWPGNVRQLRNVCRWLTVMAAGDEILADDLPRELREDAAPPRDDASWEDRVRSWIRERIDAGDKDLMQQADQSLERVFLEEALRHTGGHRQNAARLLGVGRNTLTRKLKAHHME